ncbi:MAG TPA: MFS transporter [Egibacteraceae bacterium]|nr:MFS transporter [Egibacteraceae bacterium]
MFRDRNVRGVVLARLVSASGVEASFFLGLWGKAAFEFQGSPGDLAAMAALIALGSIVGNVAAGMLVDRNDARRVLIAAEAVFVPATLALALAGSMPQLLALGLVSWTAAGVIETALSSMPPALVDGEEALQAVNARLESAGWLALVAGPALGAALVTVTDIDAVFVFDAATSVAALALLRGVRLRAPEAAEAPTASFAEVRAGLAYSYTHRPIAMVMCLGSLSWLAFGVFIALEPLYFRDVLGTGPETVGWVNALFGMGLFAGSTLLERTAARWPGFQVAIALSVGAGLGSMLYAGTASLAWVAVGAVAWSLPLGALLPLLRTLAQRETRPGMVGRVMGAITMQQNASSVLPLAFAPWAAAAFGVQGVLVASGGVVAVGAPLVMGIGRRLDVASAAMRRTNVPPPPEEPATVPQADRRPATS